MEDFKIEKIIKFSLLTVLVLMIFVLTLGAAYVFNFSFPVPTGFWPDSGGKTPPVSVKKFVSESDFKEYLISSSGLSAYFGGFGMGGAMTEREMALPSDGMKFMNGTGGGEPQRVSNTNVQVLGIDEPDIVKTDGKEIYFSGQKLIYAEPLAGEPIAGNGSLREPGTKIRYPIPAGETKTIRAFPPADLALDGKIEKQGDLLLEKNNLVIFSSLGYYGTQSEITGYDVSNPKSPRDKWNIKLENNTAVVASRLNKGKIYLITRSNINESSPCPIVPMSVNENPLSIACAEIYHPTVPVPVDATYTASILDPDSGKIEKTVSFVGSSGSTVVYVSESAIYASYAYSESVAKIFGGFIKENKDLFPVWIVEKATKLEDYDISENSKTSELIVIFQKYSNSLDESERLKMQNEMENRMNDYYERNKRNLEKTGIAKISLDSFQLVASGVIPGHFLNNFAMDEYQDNLRVAVSIGSGWGIIGGVRPDGSANDVYVLDKNLKTIGSVKDFGKTERIYSVRFIEDKGYVVTFRQTDPFYVLNLADPKNPEIAGELKIPGFSSYLHPLDATHILGIGREGSKVKISLFDVSDKNNPKELDKYMLDEYWTEVANNYHAFLLDTKHNIFFLPGSKGGYVFSYYPTLFECDKPPTNGRCLSSSSTPIIRLQRAISQNSVKRAIYLNDYLYIIGEDKITVLNENDWEKVNELKF